MTLPARRAALLAAALAVAGCGGPSPGHAGRVAAGAGVSIVAPAGWHLLGQRITALSYPVDRLLLTSYRAPRGGNCGPDRAEERLPAGGALVYLLEYRPRVGSVRLRGFPPRPAHFSLSRRALGRYECWRVPSYLIRFRAAGRPFQVHVAFGPHAGRARRVEVLRALDSLRFERLAPPPPDPYAGWHALGDETGDTLRTPPRWYAAAMPSPRRQAQPRTLFITASETVPGLPRRAHALPRAFSKGMLRGFPPDAVVLWIREERPGPLTQRGSFRTVPAPRRRLQLLRAGAGGRGTRYSLRILSGPQASAADLALARRSAAAFAYSVGPFRNRPCRRICESGGRVRVIPATPPPVSAAELEQALRTNPNNHAGASCRRGLRARAFVCRITLHDQAPALFDVKLLENGCFVAERRRRGQADYGCVQRPSGTLYLVGRTPGEATIVDVARRSVTTRRLRELAPGDPPYAIAAVGHRIVVYGRDRTYAFGPLLREPAHDLGTSWFFVPSATRGRVWLALLDPRSPPSVRALRALREVTAGGAVTAAPRHRPPHWPLVALRSGLVLESPGLELWDPRRGRVTQRLPGAIPVAGRGWLLVSADPHGRLYITDTRTRTRARVSPPRGARFVESYDGAFSPDARFVAVPATDGDGAGHVALIDVARNRARLVPGARLADVPLTAWSGAGWLFYAAGRGQIAAYLPTVSAAATVLPLRVGAFVDMAAR